MHMSNVAVEVHLLLTVYDMSELHLVATGMENSVHMKILPVYSQTWDFAFRSIIIKMRCCSYEQIRQV